ncbi:MAG: hypothetical protein WBN51_10705, partial [Gammaproteobacteria bacterium]
MTPFTKTLIGHITDVNTSEFTATLDADAGDRLPISATNSDKTLIGQPGSHVAITQGNIKILALINEVNEKDSVRSANPIVSKATTKQVSVRMTPLGEI